MDGIVVTADCPGDTYVVDIYAFSEKLAVGGLVGCILRFPNDMAAIHSSALKQPLSKISNAVQQRFHRSVRVLLHMPVRRNESTILAVWQRERWLSSVVVWLMHAVTKADTICNARIWMASSVDLKAINDIMEEME